MQDETPAPFVDSLVITRHARTRYRERIDRDVPSHTDWSTALAAGTFRPDRPNGAGAWLIEARLAGHAVTLAAHVALGRVTIKSVWVRAVDAQHRTSLLVHMLPPESVVVLLGGAA